MGAFSGSQASPEAPDGSSPFGFDPGRLLAEKDALDRVSLEQCFTTDPVERLVGEALTSAGFDWKHECHPSRKRDPVRLDFAVEGGPYIEVKRFHAERSGKQLAQAPDVILIQGVEAARWFAAAIAGEAQRAETTKIGSAGTASTRPNGIAQTPSVSPKGSSQ